MNHQKKWVKTVLTHVQVVGVLLVENLDQLDDVGVVELLHDGDLSVDLLQRVVARLPAA